jgi:uncharacterized membrane protein YkvA (DUF1232 family)
MLFAYIDHDDDLIPDHEPLIGKLDDVLLIELAWPAFVAEAEDYRDFCQYRAEEHPIGDGPAQRGAWIRDRLAEIALWQHHLRVNDSRYASDSAKPRELFHILWARAARHPQGQAHRRPPRTCPEPRGAAMPAPLPGLSSLVPPRGQG